MGQINPIEYFKENNRILYWQRNQESYKKWFKKQLKHLLLEIEEGSTDKELNSFMYRLGLGYYGIGKQSGIPSGIITEDSKKNPSTDDHVFGVVEIGKYIHQEFEKSNYDLNYMVNEWLYENLWLWMTIKVSKIEHKKENIIRNGHTIEDKKLFKHYKKVSNFLFS